jgi:hypothetical protein
MRLRSTSTSKILMVSTAALLILLMVCSGEGQLRIGRKKKERKIVTPVPISSAAPEPVTIDTVNRRWKGARCQIRFPIEIKKDRDDNGWSHSDWLKAPSLPDDKELKIRLLVSDREALVRSGYLSQKKVLRPGTAFIAQGWRLENPNKEKGLMLDLRFESLPIQARMEFKGGDRLDDLELVEQAMRIDLFQLYEVSQPVLNTQKIPEPEPVKKERVAEQSTPTQSYDPSVKILAASVQPAQVSRGGKIELIITYVIGGLPPGSGFEVVEKRDIKSGEKVMGSFDDRKSRLSGTYTTTHKIDVAANTAPGVYTFQAVVNLAGKTSEASALFEVR